MIVVRSLQGVVLPGLLLIMNQPWLIHVYGKPISQLAQWDGKRTCLFLNGSIEMQPEKPYPQKRLNYDPSTDVFFQGGIFCIVYIFICLPKVGFNDIPWLTWLFLPDFFYGLANSIWKIRNGYGSLPKNHSSMGWWSPQSRLETTGQIYVSWFNMDISMVLCREIFTGTIDFPIFSMGVSCKMSQQINWDMDIFTHFVKHDDSLPYIYIVI